jgi:hypothetical protein
LHFSIFYDSMNGWYDVSSFRRQGKKGKSKTMQTRASQLSSCVGHHACCIQTDRISYRNLERVVVPCPYFSIIICCIMGMGWNELFCRYTNLDASSSCSYAITSERVCHRLLR